MGYLYLFFLPYLLTYLHKPYTSQYMNRELQCLNDGIGSLSVGTGQLEVSRADFVPESDSEDDFAACGVDDSVDKCLVEDTQEYDHVDDVGVLENCTVRADATSEQVVNDHFFVCVGLV